MLRKIVIICGPTAVGKTGVGITLAKEFNGEIISADSQQVWRGFDIGTAKVNLTERSAIKHHLVDICEPAEHFDAEHFVELADRAIDDIVGRGKIPFVVGGTGMYMRMLEKGLCDAPPQDEEFRAVFEDEVANSSLLDQHEKLRAIDPESAAAIHPNDRTRIERALEIHYLTGVPASEFRETHGFAEKRYDALKVGLNIGRADLYQRINDRVDMMVEEGLLKEVRTLLAKYDFDCQPFKAVGYRELVAYINGEMDYDEAIELTKRNSRRYAKRQLTWFRGDPEIKWFEPHALSEIAENIRNFL
ncbi:MAG: tRNA (adenosine(37)-N6)-dimethylallyltransferase MiaA [Deltaproteobacteria bacterium]|jgi:tRNA dimethylallyltransferase|nr:tRNA (adenosine(37)-N6)-dimethylallyltransferase MiaA [Deltaproteobacteria bacterium]